MPDERKSPPFIAAFLTALLIGGAFWIDAGSYPGGLFFVAIGYAVISGLVIGGFFEHVLEGERQKMAALRFEMLRQEAHQGIERNRNSDRT